MSGWPSSWTGPIPGVPVTVGSGLNYHDIQDWNFRIQCYWALRERHAVFSGYDPGVTVEQFPWPPPNAIWNSGTIAGVVNNGDGTGGGGTADNGPDTITFSMNDVNWDPGEGFSSDHWVNYTNPACYEAHIPAYYDLIIVEDPDDPFTTIRGQIVAQTYTPAVGSTPGSGTLTVTGQPILDAVTANYIPSLSSLVGCNYYIIKRDGYWCSDRLPDKPDDNQLWVGDSSIGGATSGDTEGSAGPLSYIQTPFQQWNDGEWVDKEVLVFGSDGALHRETILHNSNDALFFSHQSWTGSGAFIIVNPGAKGKPGRNLFPIFNWYAGMGASYFTHLADDSIGQRNLAGEFATWPTGDNCEGECEGNDFAALDIDVLIDVDNDCAGQDAGNLLAPNLYKSWRGVQLDIQGLCTSYLPYMDYTGSEHNAINNWTVATFFQYLGLNSWTSGYDVATDTSGTYLTIAAAPSDLQEFPHQCWYALVNDDGSITGGSGTLTDSTTLTGADFPTGSYLPTSVIVSLGWDRWKPRHFRWRFPKTCWLPTSGDDGGVIDPPTVAFNEDGTVIDQTGQWEKRKKSQTYKTRSIIGQAVDGIVPFVDGELARHVGDNAGDVCITEDGNVAISTSSGASLVARVPYYDHFFRGKYSTGLQQIRDLSRFGSVSSGTAHSLTDNNANWWDDGINTTSVSVGYLFSDTGTATSGSSTTLVDSAHIVTGDTNPLSCWWDQIGSGRFASLGSSPYQDFILIITRYGGTGDTDGHGTAGVPQTWKVPIVSTTVAEDGSISFTFNPVDGLTVREGDVWEVIEPAYEINKWEDRVLTLTDPQGHRYHTTVTHSDNNTLFFGEVFQDTGTEETSEVVIDPGWSYTIESELYGSVFRYVAGTGTEDGTWVLPTGVDSTRLGVQTPENFKTDSTCNLETIVHDYGLQQADDIITGELYREIFHAINAMQATKASPDGWFKNRVAGTPEVYEGTILNNDASSFFGTFDDEPCYGGYDPRYPYPAMICPETVSDNEAIVEYLLQPGSCLWSNPPCIDQTGWYTLPAGDGPGSAPYVVNEYSAAFQFDGTGTLMGGLQGCSQTAVSAYLRISNIYTGIPAGIDFYNFATASGGCPGATYDLILGPDLGNAGTTCQPCTITFDAFSQPVLYRGWDKWSSSTIASDGTAVSSKLGDVSEPFTPSPVEPCDDGTTSAIVYDPPAYEYDGSSDDGYKVTDQLCILKWSFEYTGAYS